MTPEQRAALMSSACMDWETPVDLIHDAHSFEPIRLDAATAPDNPTGAMQWYAPPTDALGQDWKVTAGDGHVWLNPPYGRGIDQWIAKAVKEARMLAHLTMLTPARTDTAWYRRIVASADAVVYLDHRLLFRIRCERCTLARQSLVTPPFTAVYADRWFKRGDKTVYLCKPCADNSHGANGGFLETKPIARATFPSLLAYWGIAVERWSKRFGRMGDLRVLKNRGPEPDDRQKSLFT